MNPGFAAQKYTPEWQREERLNVRGGAGHAAPSEYETGCSSFDPSSEYGYRREQGTGTHALDPLHASSVYGAPHPSRSYADADMTRGRHENSQTSYSDTTAEYPSQYMPGRTGMHRGLDQYDDSHDKRMYEREYVAGSDQRVGGTDSGWKGEGHGLESVMRGVAAAHPSVSAYQHPSGMMLSREQSVDFERSGKQAYREMSSTPQPARSSGQLSGLSRQGHGLTHSSSGKPDAAALALASPPVLQVRSTSRMRGLSSGGGASSITFG
jgi:hypothetical protein